MILYYIYNTYSALYGIIINNLFLETPGLTPCRNPNHFLHDSVVLNIIIIILIISQLDKCIDLCTPQSPGT